MFLDKFDIAVCVFLFGMLIYFWSEKRDLEEKYYMASRKVFDRESILYNIKEYVNGGECFLGAIHYTMARVYKELRKENKIKDGDIYFHSPFTAPYFDLAGYSLQVAGIFGKKPCGKCDGCKYFLTSGAVKDYIIDVKYFGLKPGERYE